MYLEECVIPHTQGLIDLKEEEGMQLQYYPSKLQTRQWFVTNYSNISCLATTACAYTIHSVHMLKG